MKSRLLVAHLFLTAASLLAQNGKDTIETIRNGSKNEREAALRQLGVEPEVANYFSDTRTSMSGGIEWLSVSKHNRQAAIVLPCSGLFGGRFYLLERTPEWKVTDQTSGDCHYKDAVSFEVVYLLASNTPYLFVHMDCSSHGTGYVEHELDVFLIQGGHLKPLKTINEDLVSFGWEQHGGMQNRSTFVMLPNRTGYHVIEETRIDKILDERGEPLPNDHRVRRRYWSISPRTHRLSATRFTVLFADK